MAPSHGRVCAAFGRFLGGHLTAGCNREASAQKVEHLKCPTVTPAIGCALSAAGRPSDGGRFLDKSATHDLILDRDGRSAVRAFGSLDVGDCDDLLMFP
jgi:hypothetical protein